MNVASKELCQELYKLSGWGDNKAWREDMFWWFDNTFYDKVFDTTFGNWVAQYISSPTVGNIKFPAYDLGYLLRKLPPVIQEDGNFVVLQINAHGNGTWNLAYIIPYDEENRGYHIINNMDTPEDAVCKLAIKLFKEGVIE